MRALHHIAIFLLCCLFACGNLSAQPEGREFWYTCGTRPHYVTASDLADSSDSALVYILGHQACTGYVQNPFTSFYVPFEVHPDSLTTVSIPANELFFGEVQEMIAGGQIWSAPLQGGTVVIRTTDDVQVWIQSPKLTSNPFASHYHFPIKIPLFPLDFYYSHYRLSPFGSYYVIAPSDSTEVFSIAEAPSLSDTVMLQAGEASFYYNNGPYDNLFFSNCKRIIPYKDGGSFQELNTYSLPNESIHLGRDYLVRALRNNLFESMYSLPFAATDFTSYPWVASNRIATYHNNYTAMFGDPPDSVIYAFIRTSTPAEVTHDTYHVPDFQIYDPIQGVVPYNMLETYNQTPIHPTERMVPHWDYPITKHPFPLTIPHPYTPYIDLTIYVRENGLSTTALNGQSIPASAFDSFPGTNGEYYSAQFAWYGYGTLPDYITVDNPNGFTGYIHEIGYSYTDDVPEYYPSYMDSVLCVYYFMEGSSPYNYLESPYPHSNLSVIDSDMVHRCLGDTLALLVEYNPDSVPVEWIVDGISHPGDAYSFLLTTLDTLTVQCILHYECPDTTTTFVAVVPPPLLTIAHDTTVCAGATLSVEQPSALSYLWSNGAATPSITVDSAGTFQVSVTNIGCRAESDSFHVSLYGQSAVDFGNDSILCELATLLLDATQQHPAQYFWQDGSTNTTYTVYQDGDYWVVITDHCLGASDTINIGYLNDFSVNLGPDTMLCEGKTLTLNAEAPYCDYLWQDGSTQPTYLVRGPGTYSVEVSNKCFSHWDAVNINYEHCAQELYLPNAFTPGPDALNPVFLPIFSYPDEIESYRMEIYNRWGTLVVRTEEKTYGWDGANAMEGVYAVVIRYKTRGEAEKTVKGNVTVVR